MWWWWVFTFIHNCVWMFWFITRNVKIPKNSQNEFQWTTKHFFGKIISCTCDLHLKLNILNPLNKCFWSNGFLNESFSLQPFLSKFQGFKIFVNFFFHQVHLMNMYFHRSRHIFVLQKVWNQLYDFIHSFLFFIKKNAV
jgi:hypothetical protein